MKLCIISETISDFSELLATSFANADILTPSESASADLDYYDSFALLCGVISGGQTLLPHVRKAVETQIRKGKPFFEEIPGRRRKGPDYSHGELP